MMLDPDQCARLARMEEARRQTRHQLDLIERQIIRRMTVVIPLLRPMHRGTDPVSGRRKPSDSDAFMRRYRERLAAITLERQVENPGAGVSRQAAEHQMAALG